MARPQPLNEFETHEVLEAVDHLDSIRGILADGPNLEPPQLRLDLMELHKVAMRVCNDGQGDTSELVELAIEVEDQVEEIRDASERIIAVLQGITEAETDQDEADDGDYELDEE